MDFVLSIDQGTSGTKCLILDSEGAIHCQHTTPIESIHFRDGKIEQDPFLIIQSLKSSLEKVLAQYSELGLELNRILSIGISNQRESFLLWDRSGIPLTNVILWQCKRSVDICAQLINSGYEDLISDITGLRIDPYFSGTKVKWLIDQDKNIKNMCKSGNLFFGTIDTWLLYNLSEGRAYKTDYTNASRTLLFNLDSLEWDDSLINLFNLDGLNLPEILPSATLFGLSMLWGMLPSPIPITSMIGDSHAACFGEGLYHEGYVKATMGTGSSVIMNTGCQKYPSNNGMVTTICWSTEDRIDFGLEGIIVSCGSTVNWVCDNLKIADNPNEFDKIGRSVDGSGGVVFIPAFSGLGSPHWQMDRKASIHGITFSTTAAHIVRAALESYPFQLRDVINAMEKDYGNKIKKLYVDGGMTKSKITMELISNLLDIDVEIYRQKEASALGAALLSLIGNKYMNLNDAVMLSNNFPRVTLTNKGNKSNTLKAYEKWIDVVRKKVF